MAMNYTNIIFESKDRIGRLTINRPKALNALDNLTMDEISDVIKVFRDDRGLRVLIVTGAGEKAFAAGADINELKNIDSGSGMLRYLKKGQEVLNQLENVGKPTIAAVNGYALGGGCELALVCTLRIASASAKIGLPEIKLGSIPGLGGTQRLAREIGKQKALEMILTGQPIDAQEALRIGLISKVLPNKEALLHEAEDMASSLAEKAPIATQLAIEAVNRGLEMNLSEALIFEASMVSILYETTDMQEGIKAFVEKRPAAFRGE
jgi:enoyl-CoA hydratase